MIYLTYTSNVHTSYIHILHNVHISFTYLQALFEDFRAALVFFMRDKTFASYFLSEVEDWNEGTFERLKRRECVKTIVEYDMREEEVMIIQVAGGLEDLQSSLKYCSDLSHTKKNR